MRIFASKRVGSVRIGVSGDVGSKRTKSDSRVQAAFAEQAQATADLERTVGEMGRHTTAFALKIADLDVELARMRTGRDQMVSEIPNLPPDVRARATVMLAELKANIANMEAMRVDLDALMRTSATKHAAGLRSVAECYAARDAALKRL